MSITKDITLSYFQCHLPVGNVTTLLTIFGPKSGIPVMAASQ